MDNYLEGIVKEIKEHENKPQETTNRFQEHDVYDLESFLCIDKNSHDLEGQIDSLKDQIELILDLLNCLFDLLNHGYFYQYIKIAMI